MDDTSQLEFTPAALRGLAETINEMRHNLLFEIEDAGADPIAEQHFLLTITSLEAAVRHMKLAAIHQSRAIK